MECQPGGHAGHLGHSMMLDPTGGGMHQQDHDHKKKSKLSFKDFTSRQITLDLYTQNNPWRTRMILLKTFYILLILPLLLHLLLYLFHFFFFRHHNTSNHSILTRYFVLREQKGNFWKFFCSYLFVSLFFISFHFFIFIFR